MSGITVSRVYTNPGVHPYDEVHWVRRDVVLTNWRDGSINFEQRDVEFPDFWEPNAIQIVASKYFRGALNTSEREFSLKQLIDRVVNKYAVTGLEKGYFDTADDSIIFQHELTHMLLHQIFSFNSPVWFNVGTSSPQQVSACFLLAVDDSMNSILDWYKEEGMIFKGGSGSGVNLSRIRSNKELLSSGGNASGPVSFMRGADASAGTIKSGGATRRAAKMVILDVDHPDIEEFIDTKVREEEKIRVLRDAGYDMDLGGADIFSVQYQNANNSVRVSDEFMRAVEQNSTFDLTARVDGRVVETVKAQELFHQMCQAAWSCADPGIQYDDTINAWHTCPESGRITTSNPCAEYVHLDNSSCNLASINLFKFMRPDTRAFDVDRFVHACELIITAMDISICFADFPTEKIGETSRAFRQLGLGYANLGAMLMAMGIAYDSDRARDLAGAITSLMTAVAYRRSAEMAAVLDPYDGYAKNREDHIKVMLKHHEYTGGYIPRGVEYSPQVYHLWLRANQEWDDGIALGRMNGWRNAQTTLIAPTGTIGLMMSCDTTGIEPALGLVTFKKLVGGGSMQFVNQRVRDGLEALGYSPTQVDDIAEYISSHGYVDGAPGLAEEHHPVFDCAMGARAISPMGHVRMMAAVQPFLSGAISKTVNLPESATVEDVETMYMQGWKLGLKSLAIYRDNCKVGQPLSITTSKKSEDVAKPVPTRKRLPRKRASQTVSFRVGGAKGYLTSSSFSEGDLGEVFLKMSKQGSTLAGVMDAFSVAISIGLQYGVPLDTYVAKFTNMRFEPAGLTDDSDIRMASSVIDYVFRRLALDFLPRERREELGVLSSAERVIQVQTSEEPAHLQESTQPAARDAVDRPLCYACGTTMQRAGSCYVCRDCGSTSGCS